MLDLLLRNPDSKYLLVIGAYRDSEVDAAHPLVSTLDELRKGSVTITELTLRPLDPPTVTELVAETLGQGKHEVEELSALVFDKTQGNPFFLGQFLSALHQARLVGFDAASSAFTWDLGRIRGAMVTDNVVDLMLGKLHRLAQPTQRALQLAACIGHRFDLGTLSIIDGKSPADTAADLWEALREGLVVPLDGDYRLLDVSGGAASGSEAIDFEISYGFLHDRVREAAYALIPDDQKEEVHLTIGRLLWERSGQPARDADLLEIVRHLHLGARRLADDAERRSVAELDLRAGRRAKAATAYQAAFDSFTAGIELLGPQGWDRDYALCFSLHNEGAECAYLSGAIERAEALFDVILPRASSDLERARIYNLRMILCTTLGKHSEAMKAGLAGLECLGVTLPATLEEQQAAFASGPAEVTAARGDRRIEDLVNAPRLEDPRLLAVLQLLSDMLMSSFYVTPLLHPTIVARIVTLSLEHGHSDMSAFGYVTHGLILALVMNQPAEGHAYGKLALALNEKFHNAILTARLNLPFSSYLYLCEPLRAAIPYFQAGRRAALECGDFVYLSTNCLYQPLIELGAGCPLDEIRDQVERFLVLMQRTRDLMATSVLTVVRQTIANLQGKTRSRASLSDDRFDEDRFLAELEGREQPIQFFYYYAAKLQIHLLHGDTEAALVAAEKGDAVSATAALAHPLTRFRFHVCLLLLSLPPAEAEEEERRRATIAGHRDKLAVFAALCPQNFEHQIVLIDAEAARRSGKHAEAMDLYDQAISLAKENDFPQDEALANELCAKMYVAIGRAKAARSYMEDAYLGYLHWGALAKAEDIATDHRPLLSALTTGRGRRTTTSDSSASASMTTLLGQTLDGNLRDAALVVRAAQAIAGEIMLPRVIERLSKIVLESAGAERGALLLERDGELFVEATFGVDPEALDVGSSTALDARSDIAQSVALFVARTREPVVFDDAGQDRRFAVDPHITAHGVKSLLCLPLVHQGRLSGLLYLENKNAPATFNAARVELLELFSSQAAIAIEHARMVADVHAANDNVHRANTRLEAEVAGRTEELRLSNEELGAANQRLQVELVQREQAERERAELQETMIQAQRARLSEMSTPLIPITDNIMVMPLIGTVDAERAAQVLEVALEGAARHRARVVILDVTGIRMIDTHVLQTLLNVTTSLRLLGTQAVLTGITPEVAQTMVRIGTDLGAIVTQGTLQRGIAYALQLAGERADARKLG
jgi:predicted ATPase/GAF domain-containing protein